MSEFNLSVDGISSNTLGKNNKSKKECLKEKLDKDHLRQIRDKWKGKKLSLDIKFRLNINTPQPSEYEKDLDNLPKIPIDIIFGSKNDIEIFEIHSCKELVNGADNVGFDLKISEFKPHEQKSNILIPNEKIKNGIHIARNYAEYFIEQSKILCSNGNYQASIPLSIFAFEESSKCIHLCDFLQKKKDIYKKDWKKLNNHLYKHTQLEKNNFKYLTTMSNSSFQETSKIFDDIIMPYADKNLALLLNYFECKIQTKFSQIKEICLYSDWDDQKKKWKNICDISQENLKHIYHVVMFLSEKQELIMQFMIDMIQHDLTNLTKEQFKEKIKNWDSWKNILAMIEKLKKDKRIMSQGTRLIKNYFPN